MTDEAIYQEALKKFRAMVAATQEEDLERARRGLGLHAARFACKYTDPLKNPELYRRVYNIFWNHFQD